MAEETTPKSAESFETGHLELEVSAEDIEPRIWRRFLIRSTASFEELHVAIQLAFGWEDAHLWEFRRPDRGGETLAGAAQMDLWADQAASGSGLALGEYFRFRGRTKSCIYVYDFGDNWVHEVRLRDHVVLDESFERRLLGGARACPLEDCGGVPGYALAAEIAGVAGAADRAIESGYDPEFVNQWRAWDPDAFDLNRRQMAFDR